MLRECSLLLSALAIACVYVYAAPHMLAVPYLVWSPQGSEHLMAQQQAKSSYEAEAFLGRTIAAIRPEVVLAFVHPQLSSDEFSQLDDAHNMFFRSLLTSSSSQVVFPYVFTSTSVTDQLSQLVHQANPSSVSINVPMGDSCQAQLRTVSQSDVFSDGNVDLLIVAWDSTLPTECMQQIVNEVAKRSNNKYIGVVTADHPTLIDSAFTSGDRSSMLETQSNVKLQAAKKGKVLTGVQYISPAILFGVMFGGLFLLMLVCGVNCLNSVQTPLRFSATKMVVPKEY